MAKTEVGYLIGACCFGLLSLVLIIVSVSTTAWVTADIKPTTPTSTDDVSKASHGLFLGHMTRKNLGNVRDFTLYAACLTGENVCYWSCLTSGEAQTNELQEILETGYAPFQCIPDQTSRIHPRAVQPRSQIDTDEFMPAGLWIATLVFVFAAIVSTAIGLALNIYNIFYNPVEIYASPIAIVMTYAIAACSTLLTLILWGAMFGSYTSNNIAVLDTLTSVLKSEAFLGWSYFILIPAELAEIAAAGLVYYRQIKINRIDEDKVLQVDPSYDHANTVMY